MASNAAERKRAQRARQKAAGQAEVKINLYQIERDRLAHLCAVQGTADQPASVEDVVALLIRDRVAWLDRQLAELPAVCPKCQKPTPLGCGGLFKGDGACFLSAHGRALKL